MTHSAEAKPLQSQAQSKRSYEPKHLPALDGVRGIAILLVILTHLTAILRDVGVQRYIEFGWIGVDLFFVLSGFLITRILLDTRRDSRYYRRFYIRRGLRIWPLYYVYLVVSVLLVHVLGIVFAHSRADFGSGGPPSIRTPLWMYLLFIQNLYWPSLFCSKDTMAVTWSLCIEEHFYLAWPVCVRKFGLRALKYGLLALLILSPFMRLSALVLLRGAPYSTWLQTIIRFTPLHLDSIAAGCLLCLLWEKLCSLTWHFRLFTGAFLFGLAATIFCLVFQQSQIVYSFCYSALAIMFAGLVGMALNGWLSPLFTNRSLRYIGKISYGLYLIHPYVFLFLQSHHLQARLGLGHNVQAGEWIAAILAVSISLLIASLSWKFYESKMLALKPKLAP
jgi:peptidoglycan/LPS O-acetylase OafA/YrhL